LLDLFFMAVVGLLHLLIKTGKYNLSADF